MGFPNVRVVGADESANTVGPKDALLAVSVPAKLYTVSAFNDTAADLFLQVHDVAAAASAGDATIKCITPVYSKSSGGFSWADGTVFTNGIYLSWAVVANTYGLIGGNVAGNIDASFRRK